MAAHRAQLGDAATSSTSKDERPHLPPPPVQSLPSPEPLDSSTLRLDDAVYADGNDFAFAAAALEREGEMDPEPIEPRDAETRATASMEERLKDSADLDGRPRPFERSSSPVMNRKNRKVTYERVQDLATHKLHKISVYETQTRYFLIGGDVTESHWRMLKIDRTSPPGRLHITEDEVVYTKDEMNQLLRTLEDGNRAAGGMVHRATAWGLLGFIRFTECYYMLLVNKRQQVAMIGGHYIYQIEDTMTIPISTGPVSRLQSNRNPTEARYLSILNKLDLNKSFYFSYSYDLTRTLQHNIIKEREALISKKSKAERRSNPDFNSMFVWNQYLLDPALENSKNPYDWCIPVIHGSVEQCEINVYGRPLYIALIARRSRFFAGARFMKRGANDLGFVANDVETEQIVADMVVTSLNSSKREPLKNPNYTSFVQHRGSIPLYWTQDSSGVTPKPGIDLNLVDPFYATAAMHFDNLFHRYGAPVCVLNLVKTREREPRESKLLVEYQNAINYLNQQLPAKKKILYRSFDMARAAKTPGQDVIASLEEIATDLVRITGFFHNSSSSMSQDGSVQNGVIRSNCIDCLDRTNAAQFVIGKRALECQLQALGVTADASLNFDTDVINLFAHMFNDHGDTLASQYGGSHLVNTTDSYRKVNNWQSTSRDMLESFKRYYHNSFLDRERQEAYNLFLGNYIFAQGQPMLWELASDYYLHHANPASLHEIMKSRRSYIYWYTPENLRDRQLPPVPRVDDHTGSVLNDDWWHEYYRPQLISSYMRLFGHCLKSTTSFAPKTISPRFDSSPFAIRKRVHESEAFEAHPKNEVGVSDSHSRVTITPLSATQPPHPTATRISSLQQWLQSAPASDAPAEPTAAGRGRRVSTSRPKEGLEAETTAAFVPGDKSQKHQWTIGQFVENSLRPTVTDDEYQEYERYVNHPLNLSLVHDTPADISRRDEFSDYLDSANSIIEDDLVGSRLDYEEWLRPKDDVLSLTPGEMEKKRYQAYAKWLKGKSFFKQSKVDPEFRASG